MQMVLSDNYHESKDIMQHHLINVEEFPVSNQTTCMLVTFGNVT